MCEWTSVLMMVNTLAVVSWFDISLNRKKIQQEIFLLAFLYYFPPFVVFGLTPMDFISIHLSKNEGAVITKLYITFSYCAHWHGTSAVHTCA